MKFRLQLEGMEAWRRELQRVKQAARQASAAHLEAAAQRIMFRARGRYVPVATGALRDSGEIEPVRHHRESVEIVFGFTAKYALVTHENPRAGKTGGVSPRGTRYTVYARSGQYKFLETPLNEEQGTFLADYAEAVQGILPI